MRRSARVASAKVPPHCLHFRVNANLKSQWFTVFLKSDYWLHFALWLLNEPGDPNVIHIV